HAGSTVSPHGYRGLTASAFSLPWRSAVADSGINLTHFANAFEFFYMDPIIHPQLTQSSAIKILGATLAAALLAGIYPAWKATRLSLSQALRIQ
ncbi:MAG: hypothetical protein KZQ72_02685, partial [Candidatus Thiodiazotropha sp. (ex Cardiolucina cf. quadrata)]|nr:hypothetical protein [Candidatus Thiodiazotropha sp. (ex Cardiolucina cf. quadrata)]